MRNLFAFIWKHNFFFLFLLLEILSLYLIFAHNRYQQTVFVNVTGKFSGAVLKSYHYFTSYIYLKDANEKLAIENAWLREHIHPAFLKSDSKQFVLNDTLYRLHYQYINAEVISNTTNFRDNYLLLNKGSRQGIRNHMAVIAEQAIVGQVIAVSDNFSWVMSVLHKDSKISAKFQKNNQLVNVEWTGGSYRKGEVREIPKHVQVKAGDTIVTSGNSNIFPGGIIIGQISDFVDNKAENFNSATLMFTIDYNRLAYVQVVIDLMREEKENLMNQKLPGEK